MIVLRSTYDRDLYQARDSAAYWHDRALRAERVLASSDERRARLDAELADLRQRLAKWEGPRERGIGGRFVKGAR